MTTLILIAKEPIAGRVKTRLQPQLSPHEAAHLAALMIADTVEAVRPLPATRRILLLDGERPPAGCEGYDVVPQVAGGLDDRLAAIFDELNGPTLLIGMDTPQLTAADLAPAFDWPAGVDAFVGPASDGGFWALGMANPRGDLIRGVPMSRYDTGRIQLDRLESAGLNVHLLNRLRDVDTFDDALEVADLAPHTGFAAALRRYAVPAPVAS